MTHGSLFSGIGGFDLAAEWMGWENIFHCEWNPFGQKVLKYYWPNAISYENICTTDFTVHRGKVDIITGGFPCQPYSLAGKRLGKEDERHLWPEMLRTIREVQPRWVVGENVFGLVNWSGGLVFHEVQADLEAQGYEVQPYILPAVSVNAPHRRDRVWFVAYANGIIRKCSKGESNSRNEQSEKWKKSTRITSTRFSISQNASDTNSERLQGGQKINRWKEFNSEWAGDGDDLRTVSKNNSRYSKCNFENFPTISPVCNGDDGLSERLDAITFPKWRAESVKAGGNAIVPQVAYQIFKTIQAYERSRIAKEDR